MKNKIYAKSKQMSISTNKETKKIGKIINKYIDNFNCYYCLDTNKCWKTRDNSFFAGFDRRGQYDIIRCNHCSNGNWYSCSHTNNLQENGIKIFNINDNIEDRIKELKKIYKNKIDKPESSWKIYQKNIRTKN